MKAWQEAFIAAQAEFPHIGKDKSADMGNYSYKYADLGSILDAVLPVLKEHGLALSQSAVNVDGKVGVETRIYGHDHTETFGPLVLPGGNTAQGYGSAITYARRYALCAALGISPDEDDDGARASAPQRTDVAQTPTDWLRNAVQMFGEWSDAERREQAKNAMSQLAYSNPMTQEETEAVHEFMAGVYYEQHPGDDERPF